MDIKSFFCTLQSLGSEHHILALPPTLMNKTNTDVFLRNKWPMADVDLQIWESVTFRWIFCKTYNYNDGRNNNFGEKILAN